MKKFLEKVAEFILEKDQDDLLKTAVIFPNKRSEVFLKDHLKNKTSQTIWLPQFYTIDEFVGKASGFIKMDPIQIYFELFDIHKKLAGTDAREIDDFLTWAPIMLSDFNDIDNYLADPERIFSHLSEARAIETWNTDRKPLTELQTNYLAFYNSLIDYYKLLNEKLRSKNAAYNGMMYRHLATNAESLAKSWPWKNFILVGFSALSAAEQKIFDYLNAHFNTDILWDADTYYFTSEGKMEAGYFISKMIDHFGQPEPLWIENSLLKDKKTISILGTSKQLGQVKFAGHELKRRFRQTAENLSDTAVVLADENLLVPLLNSLPDAKDKNGKTPGYNVTMGYPVSNGPFSRFIDDWLSLLINKTDQKDGLFSVSHFVLLISNPVFRTTIDFIKPSASEELKNDFLKSGLSFFSRSKIDGLTGFRKEEEAHKIIDLVLLNSATPQVFIASLIQFLNRFKDAVNDTDKSNFLLKEQLILMFRLVKKLQRLVETNTGTINLKALQKIIIQLIRRSEVNLKGEPLSEVQIMGMLETRNLDFKNIILLSANEGILPKADTIESFIPFDIRSYFKLPLPKDKTDVYAYHFYRLLQRAENITLVYNSESGELGGGEPSRYILQLKSELSKLNKSIKIEEKLIDLPPIDKVPSDKIEIKKDEKVMELIRQKLKTGLSPSSLSVFINCPLQFYFSQLLNLKTPDDLEKSIESDVFGTVIHAVLEEIYLPFKGKQIDNAELSKRQKMTDVLLNNQFLQHFHEGDLKSGKNYLTVEVARKYIQRFISMDIAQLRKQPARLLSVEEKLNTTLSVAEYLVKLKGTIDRIESVGPNDEVRLIDYKTGGVIPKDLELKNLEELISDPDNQKIFQLLFYSFLYEKNFPDISPTAGIYSLRKPSGGLLTVKFPEDETWKESKEEFEKLLVELILKLINPELPFEQTEDEQRCFWCDFKDICNRKERKSY